MRKVQDLLEDRKTPNERRFREPFKGAVIPFGGIVEYYPISSRDHSRLHQGGKNVLPGKFSGYELIPGGIWKGDILVADLEELENMDASEIHPRRINAKEVFTSERRFPNSRWYRKIVRTRSRIPGTHPGAASTCMKRRHQRQKQTQH